MNPVIRAYEARVEDINGAERSIVAKISTQDIDRYNTVFLSRGCDVSAYNQNRVVLWCHGKDPQRGERPIGKNQWVRIDRGSEPKIIAKTIFNDDEFSQQLFRDYQNGFLNAWSIAALPTEQGRPTQDELRTYPNWSKVETVYRQFDMLEYSACGVPGNSSCTTVNENEVRDLSEMVTRGYYIFPEVRYLVDKMNESESDADIETIETPDEAVDSTEPEAVADEATEAEVAPEPVERVLDSTPVVEIAPETPAEVEAVTEADVAAKELIEDATEFIVNVVAAEPVLEPGPAPPVEPPAPELPPLVGRTFEAIAKDAGDSIDAWQGLMIQRIDDLGGWLRGEA